MDTICALIPVALILFILLIVWVFRMLTREEESKIVELEKMRIREARKKEKANRKANRKASIVIPFNLEAFQKERKRIEQCFRLFNEHMSCLEDKARRGDLVAYGEWKCGLKKMHVLEDELKSTMSTTNDMTKRELARHHLSLIEGKYRNGTIYLDGYWQE